MGGADVGEVEWNTASGTMDPRNGSPPEDLEKAQKFTGMPREANGDPDSPSTDLPQDNSRLHARESSSASSRLFPRPSLLSFLHLPSFRPSLHILIHPLMSTALQLSPRSWILGSPRTVQAGSCAEHDHRACAPSFLRSETRTVRAAGV